MLEVLGHKIHSEATQRRHCPTGPSQARISEGENAQWIRLEDSFPTRANPQGQQCKIFGSDLWEGESHDMAENSGLNETLG